MRSTLGEDGRCVRSGLLPDQCAHCTGAAQREAAREAATRRDRQQFVDSGATLEARYAGRCAGCGQSFEIGEQIRPAPEVGRWLGPCCAAE